MYKLKLLLNLQVENMEFAINIKHEIINSDIVLSVNSIKYYNFQQENCNYLCIN